MFVAKISTVKENNSIVIDKIRMGNSFFFLVGNVILCHEPGEYFMYKFIIMNYDK